MKIHFIGTKGNIQLPECDDKNCYQCTAFRNKTLDYGLKHSSLGIFYKNFKAVIDVSDENFENVKHLNPNVIFFTHLHPDHYTERVKELNTLIVFPNYIPDVNNQKNVTSFTVTIGQDKITFEFLPVFHSIKYDTYAIKITKLPQRITVLYAPDHLFLKKSYLQNVDVFIGDGAKIKGVVHFNKKLNRVTGGHATYQTQINKAKKANVSLIYFTHYGHIKKSLESLKNMFPNAEFAKECMELDLQKMFSIKEEIHRVKTIPTPKTLRERQVLQDDWRIVCAWYSAIKQGKPFKYSKDDVVTFATKIVKALLDAGIVFHPNVMQDSSRELLALCFSKLASQSIVLPKEKIDNLIKNKVQGILTANRRDFTNINYLCDNGNAIAVARFRPHHIIHRNELQRYSGNVGYTPEEIIKHLGSRLTYCYHQVLECVYLPEPIKNPFKPVLVVMSLQQKDITKMDNKQLIYYHAYLHKQFYQILKAKEILSEHIINEHILVVQEMEKREMEHRNIDYLDFLTAQMLGRQIPGKVNLQAILPYFKKKIVLSPQFVALAGSCAVTGFGNDMDFIIFSPRWEPITEFRLFNALPKWLRFKCHFTYSKGEQCFTNHIPLYRLVLEPLPHNIVCLQEDKCVPGVWFRPCKAIAGYRKAEAYSLDQIFQLIDMKPLWPYRVDGKYDGFRCQIHKSKNRVVIYSEEGTDFTHRFPTFVKEALAVPYDFIVDCEITGVTPKGEHMGRAETAGYANRKDEPNDGPFTANIFDILYYDKQDLHNLPLSQRNEYLQKFAQTTKTFKKLKVIPYTIVNNKAELEKAIKFYSAIPGSEGAMIKSLHGRYNILTGICPDWIKFKKEVDIDVIVLKRVQVVKRKGLAKPKKLDAYYYLCGIFDNQKRIIPIGRTFITSLKVNVGDILRVAYGTLFQYYDPERKIYWFRWWSPRVLEHRYERTEPDNISLAIEQVKATKGKVLEGKIPKEFAPYTLLTKEELLKMVKQ